MKYLEKIAQTNLGKVGLKIPIPYRAVYHYKKPRAVRAVL